MLAIGGVLCYNVVIADLNISITERRMNMKNHKKRLARYAAAAGSALAACAMLAMTVFADGEAASSGDSSTGTASGGSALGALLIQLSPFIIALILLYLIMLRPQQKREKEAQAMRENVRVGDEVCTAGGIIGIVLKVNDDSVVLETGGERNKIRIKKWAIHENITRMEEQQAAERERKAARKNGIATAAASMDTEGKKKKTDGKKNASDEKKKPDSAERKKKKDSE